MNKNINSKLAIATIAFIATAATSLLLILEKKEENAIQKIQTSAEVYHKNISRVATLNDDDSKTAGAAEWKIVSGNPDDLCTIPVYEGSAVIHAWYVYDLNYEKKKEWLLRIADDDRSKLPLFESNQNRKEFHLRVRLDNLSPEMDKKLKNASAENPVEIQISRYLAFCEGVPIASIKSAENI